MAVLSLGVALSGLILVVQEGNIFVTSAACNYRCLVGYWNASLFGPAQCLSTRSGLPSGMSCVSTAFVFVFLG